MWHEHMVKSVVFSSSAPTSLKLSIWNAVNPIVFHNASGYELRAILPVLQLTALHFHDAFGRAFTGNKPILRSLHLLSVTTWFLPATANRADTLIKIWMFNIYKKTALVHLFLHTSRVLHFLKIYGKGKQNYVKLANTVHCLGVAKLRIMVNIII